MTSADSGRGAAGYQAGAKTGKGRPVPIAYPASAALRHFVEIQIRPIPAWHVQSTLHHVRLEGGAFGRAMIWVGGLITHSCMLSAR